MTKELIDDARILFIGSEKLSSQANGDYISGAIKLTILCAATPNTFDACVQSRGMLKDFMWEKKFGSNIFSWSGFPRGSAWEGFPDTMK